MNSDPMKKTGATPLVDEGQLGGGKVLGVIDVRTVLVKFRDGHGQESVRLAAIIPGGEVYFFDNKALDLRPAQGWLKSAINEHIKE